MNLIQGLPGLLQASGIGPEPQADPLHLGFGRLVPQRQRSPQVEALAPLLDAQPCPLDSQLRVEGIQAVAKVHN